MFLEAGMDIAPSSRTFSHPRSELSRSIMSPSCTGYFDCGQNYFTKRSGHDSYLVIFTLSGAGEVVYNDKKYIATKNDVVIIDCDFYQEYRTSGARWEFYFVHINKDFANIFNAILCDGFLKLCVDDAFNISLQFANLYRLEQIDTIEKLLNSGKCIISIVSDIYNEKVANSEINKRNSDSVEKALSFVSQNFLQDITVDSICSHVNVSKFHFIRIFKEYTGNTPYEHIKFLRLNYAKKLILSSNMTLEAIAQQINYLNASSFIRAFKSEEGCTPSKYKELMT